MAEGPITVLLVEDNPGDASLIHHMLSKIESQFLVTHVTRLQDAVEQLSRRSTDVMLLDLGLPDSFGLQTLERARSSAPNVPIIVITGISERDMAVEALSRPFNQWPSFTLSIQVTGQ